MRSHKKLELSRDTLRALTSDVASEQLEDVRGGENVSLNTCLDCVTDIISAEPTWLNPNCWPTR